MTKALIKNIDVITLDEVTLDEAEIKAEAERGAFQMLGSEMRSVREYRG